MNSIKQWKNKRKEINKIMMKVMIMMMLKMMMKVIQEEEIDLPKISNY